MKFILYPPLWPDFYSVGMFMILREEEIINICLTFIGFLLLLFLFLYIINIMIIYVKEFYILHIVLTSVFLFKILLDLLLYAGSEEVTPSYETGATAERKS